MSAASTTSRVVGVDLAAATKGTGLAVVDWSPGRAQLVDLRLDVSDAEIVAAVDTDAVLGLDCPIGWPDAFVAFVAAHARGDRIVGGGKEWRETLVYRPTDRVVRCRTGRWPLSVSADRLGVTAMRGAELLTALADAGVAIDRAARGGRVFVVYPGAALTVWKFDKTRYRVDPVRRAVLLDALLERAPWLDLGGHRALMISSADAFDAVIAALLARVAALGRFEGPPDDLVETARREGWVVLPDIDVADLVDPDPDAGARPGAG